VTLVHQPIGGGEDSPRGDVGSHDGPDQLERRLRERLDALGPAPRAELLHVLMLPDFERADRIGEFWSYPESRTFAARSCSGIPLRPSWPRARAVHPAMHREPAPHGEPPSTLGTIPSRLLIVTSR
jgi:hypothetical protein